MGIRWLRLYLAYNLGLGVTLSAIFSASAGNGTHHYRYENTV
jgi:hypothetical protein